MKAEELDRIFDEGADVDEFVDWDSAERPTLAIQHVTIDLPGWMGRQLERQAETLNVSREVLIKFWIAERLPRAPPQPIAAE